MNLDQFISARKRETQYGNPATVNDQAAKDVLVSINTAISYIAKNWPWDWLYQAVTITLVAGTTDYTLPITSGILTSLKDSNDKTVAFTRIGRDAVTGARKIRITDTALTGVLTGSAKLNITAFVEADLGTAKSMLPFPADGEDVLREFVLADIYRLQDKKDLIFPQKASAENALKVWRGQESTEPSKKPVSSLPVYLKDKMTNRKNGYVV
jgi:hypothetical protein